MLHRASGQPYGRRQQALYDYDSEKKEQAKHNNWIEEQLAVSDDESDDSDIDWDSEQAALGLGGQTQSEIAAIGEQWLQEEFKIE